ncbi:hypothetical protein J2S09_005162 [Bacillus fengqiuensis]|nr:hypothetical protein [Bacillus fengqiuensis]
MEKAKISLFKTGTILVIDYGIEEIVKDST